MESTILTRGLKKIDGFFDLLSKASAFVISIVMIAVTLMIFAGVINRTFFETGWLFVEEYAALALIPMSYMAMGYTLRWNRHLRMDILVRNVPGKTRKILGIFACVFSLICIVFMVLASLDWFVYTVERKITSSGTMRTPLWFISGTIVAGLILFAIDMILLTINRVIDLVTGKAPLRFIEDEAAEGVKATPQEGE